MAEAERVDPNDVRIFSGRSNPALAQAIAGYLQIPLSPTRARRFSDGNLQVQLGESVRSRVVLLVQSFSVPVSDHLVELLLMLDAARGAAAREVHAIVPYYSFARSDKKDAPRISIAARLMARLIHTAGATHVMTMSLHSAQVHGFFDVPTDPLTARPCFEDYFRRRDLSGTVVVAPDAGRARSATRFASKLGLPVIVGNKTRLSDREVRLEPFTVSLSGFERAIVYDDEIAAGTSVIAMVELLASQGVREVKAVCTHGVFSGDALDRLSALPQLTEIVASDTIAQPPEKRVPKLTVLSVAPLFGEAIRRNYLGQSITDLFSFWEEFQAEA
jgi:ribose-phosphate pyrophosphokinase